jgi:single-strand DNA-binding protein
MAEIGVNKVILIGRTGADTEVKYTAGGKAVANFSLAINESFRRGDGEQRDRVQWVRCVAWGKLAEICGQYLNKGKQAYAEGRLQTRKYDDRDGNERTVTEIVVSQLRLLGGSRNGDGDSHQATPSAHAAQADISDQDIPF